MKEMNKVAIIQCVWRQGQGNVVVRVLTPNVSDKDNTPDSFYFNVLPFAEDAREFHFPSFSHLPSSMHPNEKKQEAADKLVHMLYLAPPEKQEVLPRDFTPNPVLEIYIITVADTFIKLLFELGIGMAVVVGFFDQMNVIS
ncbi:hypothetical protein T459_24098 [Capsicum annuum]|uniref:Ku domain-containing protein n=1 Tax=Capsicum annuum TaxID=4072 RepID=A0A2G2YUA6_CAPAN|nr:hypothetical protein T459_24098 [Capsicum annuum]